MENFELLTPGMKIREIRKRFSIKQHEIAGSQITRNLISILENDKANITETTAKIIAENINNICKGKNIDFKVEPEYFLEGMDIQIDKIIDEFLNYIGENEGKVVSGESSNLINRVEEILKIYGLDRKKYHVYMALGDVYEKFNEYYAAYTYYIKAYENLNKIHDLLDSAKLILNISYCCIRLGRYKEAIDFSKSITINSDELPKDINFKMLFNNAIAFKNLMNYDKAIEIIQVIEADYSMILDGNFINKFNVLSLKANSLKELGRYNEAIDLNRSLLDQRKHLNTELYLLIYCNILEIYIVLNDVRQLRIYLDYCMKIINEYSIFKDKRYSSQIYYDLGVSFFKLHNLERGIEYIINALSSAKESKNTQTIMDSVTRLFEIYVEMNDSVRIANLKNELQELIHMGLLTPNNLIVLKFIKYFNSIMDFESSNNFIDFILNDSKR